MKLWARLAVAALLAIAAGAAQAGDLDAARAAARAKRLPALVELATWCSEQKLYRTRNELAAEIVVLDPSHTAARQWLRHRLGPDGEWESPAREPPASDRNDEARAQLPAMRTKLFAGTAAELHAVLRDLGDAVSPGKREAVLAEIIDIAPGIKRYREEHQEVRTSDGWRLRETVRGAERREQLAAALRKERDRAAGPRRVELPGAAQRSDLRWLSAWKAGGATVAATTSEDEAREIARHCSVVPAYLRAVLGGEFTLKPDLTIYLLSSKEQVRLLIEAHAGVDETTRQHYERFAGTWLVSTGNEYAAYSPDRMWRVESSVGQQVSAGVSRAYNLWQKQPWARKGFRLRLTHDLVGTRIVTTKKLSEYGKPADDWAPREGREDRDWYDRASELLTRMGPADLAGVLGRSLNQQTRDDYVVCNAIAAYYIEGRPGETATLLRQMGEGLGPEDALLAASNLDIEALRLRMIRWLRERT